MTVRIQGVCHTAERWLTTGSNVWTIGGPWPMT